MKPGNNALRLCSDFSVKHYHYYPNERMKPESERAYNEKTSECLGVNCVRCAEGENITIRYYCKAIDLLSGDIGILRIGRGIKYKLDKLQEIYGDLQNYDIAISLPNVMGSAEVGIVKFITKRISIKVPKYTYIQ